MTKICFERSEQNRETILVKWYSTFLRKYSLRSAMRWRANVAGRENERRENCPTLQKDGKEHPKVGGFGPKMPRFQRQTSEEEMVGCYTKEIIGQTLGVVTLLNTWSNLNFTAFRPDTSRPDITPPGNTRARRRFSRSKAKPKCVLTEFKSVAESEHNLFA